MRTFSFSVAFVCAALAAPPAFADALRPVQVQIESRFVTVEDNFLDEIGINFGAGFSQSFSDSTDLVPLRENAQPTGGTLFEFDSDSLDGVARFGVDLVGPAFDFLGAPTVLRIGLGAEGSQIDSSDDKGDVMIPAGQQAALVSLDGQQLTFINDPTDVRFETEGTGFQVGPSLGFQSQVTPGVQLLTSLETGFVSWNQESSLWFNSGGVGFSDETEFDSQGASIALSISPVITLHDQIDLSITGTVGTLVLDSDLSRTRSDNQATTEAGDSRTTVSGIVGMGAGVTVRPIPDNRSSVGIETGFRYFSDVPILRTAFDTGRTSRIGTGDRSELLVLITARIVIPSED